MLVHGLFCNWLLNKARSELKYVAIEQVYHVFYAQQISCYTCIVQ